MNQTKNSIRASGTATKLAEIRVTVLVNANRVAALGNWPLLGAATRLTSRIPADDGETAPGLDAGLCCALGLIPEDKQTLAATLHAAYTPEAVAQVRIESKHLLADAETTWWLAACAVCKEGEVDAAMFLDQIAVMEAVALDSDWRRELARKTLDQMLATYSVEFPLGAPFGKKDGAIQAAHIAGHPFGTMYSEIYGLYFIGTFLPSLGLEDFAWSDEKDEQGRAKSGPVHGSNQFVKCADEDEFRRAVDVVRSRLL